MGNNFLGIFLGPLFGYLADFRSLSFSVDVFQWTFGALLAATTLWSWKALTRLSPPSPGPQPPVKPGPPQPSPQP